MALDEYAKGGDPNEFPCVLEYGRVLPTDLGIYIEEHCDVIAEHDGIERFSQL